MVPTARSEINVSSLSPDLCEIIVLKPINWANLITSKVSELEHKNSLLTEKIDLDFIEILIREKFLFGKEGETTYILQENDKNN